MKNTLRALFIFTLLFSCSTEDDSNNSQNYCETDIPFLQSGRVMNYLYSGVSGTSITIGNCDENGYEVERISPFGTGTDIWRQNGDYLETDSNGNGDYWSKIYKLNAQLGDTWTHTQADGDEVTHTVISVDSTITVPAGTFTCKVFKYDNTGIINSSYVFWHDEIGNIKEDAGFLILELESYEE
tara:strand:- start:382 stop:933 length:552 start_codon:yes stop_codon:yes gene_type:complete